MHVFVTGATGFVGSAVVDELIAAGHSVTGLVRSDASAQKLAATGAKVLRGDLTDLGSLTKGATEADGVIHTAFIHDFSRFLENCQIDRVAIETLGAALSGSERPLIVTSGVGLLMPGRLATEDAVPSPDHPIPRVSEQAAFGFLSSGPRVMAIRLAPSVHDVGDHGFVPTLIGIARQTGVSAYVGNGANRWPGVYRRDAAKLYRLALEKGTAGSRYHGTAEEGVPFREIAAVIGKHLNVPVVSKTLEEAEAHFTWFARFAALDCPSSSEWTQSELGWHPTGPGLLADLDSPAYFPG